MDEFRPVPIPPSTLVDRATDALREAIRQCTLPPGTRLVERDLADRLQMSRIPIREAMRRLTEEGLLTKIPHRGTFVRAPSVEDLEEIASLRIVLERFVMERVMARWSPADEERLHALVEQMRVAAAHEDVQTVFACDRDFHQSLWEMAGHSLLLQVVTNLRSRIDAFLYGAAMATPTFRLDTYVAAHEELAAVIARRDVVAAQEIMTQHIWESVDRILAAQAAST